MPDITDAKGSDLMRYGLFGATGYDTNNKLIGYGAGFGTQNYTHDDGKKARNLVILGKNSNVLGKGNIKITTNDSAAIQEKGKLKTIVQYLVKSLFCLYIIMLLMTIEKVFGLLITLNSINLKLIKIKFLPEN